MNERGDEARFESGRDDRKQTRRGGGEGMREESRFKALSTSHLLGSSGKSCVCRGCVAGGTSRKWKKKLCRRRQNTCQLRESRGSTVKKELG